MKSEAAQAYEASMVDFFTDRINLYDITSVHRAGWSKRATQYARFKVLSHCGLLYGDSILDVGCGTGDLYGHLIQAGYKGNYLGIDLFEENCQEANRLYKENLFIKKNVLDFDHNQTFDYVVASGIFFLPTQDWEQIVIETLTKMYVLCRVGVAANFLSDLTIFKNYNSYYASPAKIIEICVTYLSVNFQIRHDYVLKNNDFTLFAYKDKILV